MKRKGVRGQLEKMASALSVKQGKPWYVCDKVGERGKVLSEENLKRYMQHGYTVRCAFYQGERYKNVYTFGGGIQCVL